MRLTIAALSTLFGLGCATARPPAADRAPANAHEEADTNNSRESDFYYESKPYLYKSSLHDCQNVALDKVGFVKRDNFSAVRDADLDTAQYGIQDSPCPKIYVGGDQPQSVAFPRLTKVAWAGEDAVCTYAVGAEIMSCKATRGVQQPGSLESAGRKLKARKKGK